MNKQVIVNIVMAILLSGSTFLHVANAQVNTYSFSQSLQPFAQVSHGIELGNSANAGLRTFLDSTNLAGSTTATTGYGFPIGFNFIYRGVSYDRFGIINSGWICLGRSVYGAQAVDIGQLQYQPLERVGPLNDTLRARIVGLDANLVGNGTTSSLTYQLIGDSTDLVLVIKWKNYKLFQSSGTNSTSVNFEIRLNAIDQSIDIRYGEMGVLNYTGTTLSNVGLGGFAMSDFNNRKTPVNKDWNATVPGTFNSDDCVMQSTSVPPAMGLNFHWSPPPCAAVTSVLALGVTTNSLSLLWTTPAGTQDPEFEYVLNTSATPPLSGIVTTDSTVSFTTLEPSTVYYMHIRTRCNPTLFSTWTSHPFSTLCDAMAPFYDESFDTIVAPALPECLSVINNNPESQTWRTEEWTGINFTNSLAIAYEPILDNDDWVFLPGLDLVEDTTYILSLDFYSFNGDDLLVYAGTFPAIQQMVLVDTFASSVETNNFSQHFTIYSPPADGVYYFALRSLHADIYVDNIAIEKYTCTPPDSMHVVVNELNNVVLAWTPTSSPGTTFEYAIASFQTYPPEDVQLTSEDTVQLTGLSPSTPYYFYLRSSCGGNSYSPWQVFSFDTRSVIDECVDAMTLIPSPGAECEFEQFSTRGATDSGIPASTCPGQPDDDVWFKFVATGRSHAVTLINQCYGGGGGGGTLSPLPPTDPLCQPLIVEWRKHGCGDTLISCIEIQPGYTGDIIETDLQADSTYYVRVFGKDSLVRGQQFGICISTYPLEDNNSCANAILLPVSTTSCIGSPDRDIAGADAANTPLSNCGAPPYYDLWYKFVTTSTTHIIEVAFSEGGDGVVDVFGGACASLTLLACADSTNAGAEQLTLTGLTIGQTLYIRVFDAAGMGSHMSVSICVKVPIANDHCANAINIPNVSGKTLANPVNANSFSTVGTGSCSGFFADDDLWYKFTAVNDTHLIVVIPTNPSPMIMPVIELFGGDCNAASVSCSASGELLAVGLIPGNEYFFRIYSAAYLAGRGNFRVGITIPPPNIYCNTATNVTVNQDQSCNLTTTGTMIGAGVKNEIWFSFTATHPSMVITVNDSLGMEMALYDACDGQFLTGEQATGRIHYKNCIIGHTYYFKLYLNVFSSNNYQYFQQPVSVCIMESPAHDECSGALDLPTQLFCDVMTPGSTTGATPSITGGSCQPGQNDIWYRFTATSASHKILIHPAPGIAYVYGQVFKGACGTQSLACFSNGIASPDAYIVLDGLEVDSVYTLRVAVSNPSFPTGDFSVCISSPPANDQCLFATPLLPASTNQCNTALPGTMINATPSLGRINVWYYFTAVSSTATIKVTPTSAGFDPGIKLWNPKPSPTLDDCVFTIFYSFDDVHLDYQPEVITLEDLVIGNAYYVEVFLNEDSDTTGTFDICMYDPSDIMVIHSATYETYPFDTVVAAGTWNQPVTKVILNMSGVNFNKTIRSLKFNLEGTTSMADIRRASLYIDTKVWPFNNQAVVPYKPFGKPGQGVEGQNPAPFLFGTPIDNPGDTIVFTGEFQIKGESYGGSIGGPNNYQRFLYLVLEISCDALPGNEILATCQAIVVDEEILTPFPGDHYPLPIVPLDRYDTRSDGHWNDGATWVCGSPPPYSPACMPVHIYHDVRLDDTAQVGKVSVYFGRTLSIVDGAHLTMGASSQGSNAGFSDKDLSCEEGSLFIKDASMDINGAFLFGSFGGERYGNGICCEDGPGYYSLSVGGEVITRDSTYTSVDYFPFCVEGGMYQGSQSPLIKPTGGASLSDDHIQTLKLFSKETDRSTAGLPGNIKEYSLLHLDASVLSAIRMNESEEIEISLPLEKGAQTVLALQRVDHILEGSVIRTAPDMQQQAPGGGLHYRGSIEGQSGSLVTMSIFDDEVIGIISTPGQPDMVLGKLGNSDTYIAYNDHQVKEYFHFSCETPDDGEPYRIEQLNYKRTDRSAGDCIQLYIEVDYDIYIDKGGLVPTQNYIAALCNQVIALYQAENIGITISEILIWNSPSVYIDGTMSQTLERFKSTRTVFNGDLGVLLSYQFNGGLAQLDGLCRSEQKYSLAYAGIYPTFENVPTYSWSVEVMAHEIGHLLGSRHTHACVWNGNNTALDGCYTPEGGCEGITELPSNGGTVMSYCHLTEAGINFSEGFGTQPGNVMRYNVDQASCTQSCQGSMCTLNDVTLTIKTDNLPMETTWEIRDSNEVVIYKGGPYIIGNHLYTKSLCLPDGCYSLVILDSTNPNPGGTFIAVNSTITTDWNDGVSPPEKDYFRLLSSNLYTDDLRIIIMDPGFFLYNMLNYENQDLNGSLTLGGGDDQLGSTGFNVHTSGGAAGLLILDSLIVDGGLYTQNRHTMSNGNFVSCRNLWIKPGAELSGGFGINGNMINDGLFTSSLNRNLSFCGDMTVGYHFTNTTNSQTLSGTGLFRPDVTAPIPASQEDNQVTMLRVDNTYSGLNLEIPLGIKNTLRIRSGRITNTDTSLITLGDSLSAGILSTDPTNDQWWSETPFDGDITSWDGGYITGPFRRWFEDMSASQEAIMPVGKGDAIHPCGIYFSNTAAGYVTAEFKDQQPGVAGLPLSNEQNTTIGFVSPDGFWNVTSTTATGAYTMAVDASGFTTDGVEPITSPSSVRLIKRPTNGAWQNSGSTTTSGPLAMSNVKAEGLTTFSDFAIGLNCGNVVTSANDNVVGSLRYVLANCIASGDTVKFDSSLSLLLITSDTIILDKHVTIYASDQDNIVISGSGTHSLFKVEPTITAKIQNLGMLTDSGVEARAIYNKGNLSLENVEIHDSGLPGNAVLNKGMLTVIGQTGIHVP